MSDASSLILHALRVKGRADTAALGRAVELDEVAAGTVLDGLAADGWVTLRPGPRPAWALTPEGSEQHRRALVAERDDDRDAVDAISAAYQGFVALDLPVKAACTAWQVRDLEAGAPLRINDHADPVYDRAVIARLTALHTRALDVVGDLARAADRFGSYGRRLEDAHARVLAGDGDAFTKPLVDSYHDVWMELHEDLLATLHLERDEAAT